MSKNNYQLLLQKLDEFIRKFYVNQMIRGTILFFSFALALFFILVLAEYYGHFNVSIRTVLFFCFAAFLLGVFVFFIAQPLLKMLAIGKRISHEKASQIIGRHFAEIDDKLFNVLQLKNIDNQKSTDLIQASINQKIKQLKPIPFSLAINLGENKRYLKYFIIPGILLIGLAAYEPKIITDSTNRLVAYSTEFKKEAPYDILIENDQLTAFKNEDFTIHVHLKGNEIPTNLSIISSGQRFLMKTKGENRFSYTFRNIQNALSFTFFDGEFESITHKITALDKPILGDLSIHLTYPGYLNKKSKIIENTGDLLVPEGTQIKWVINAENTTELLFIDTDSSTSVIKSGENEFLYSKRYFSSTQYGLSSANEHIRFKDTTFYALTVIPDLHPSIKVDVKEDSLSPKVLHFQGAIKDDYGFSNLYFHSRYIGANDSIGEKIKTRIPINKTLPQSAFYHSWNTSSYAIKAGDKIEYFFEVWDNDGVNGSKSSRTKTMVYKAPTKDELSEKEKRNNEEVKKELKESIALTKEIKKDLEELKEKLVDKKNLSFQDKKQVQSLLDKQKKVQESIQKLNEKNRDNNQMQEEYNPIDEALMEKQKQLQELFENVMTEEMKEMMDEIEKMMEKLNKDDLQKSLEKIELSNEELDKEMDRNLELFKQLEIEKELAEAKKKINELKEKQAQLKEESKNKKSEVEEIEKEQKELNQDFEELSEKLDEIKEKNKELEQPNKLEDTKPLEEKIKEDMKESAEELSQKDKEKASESQQDSEEKMEELSEKLNAMQMQMSAQANAENLEDLRAILENLIQLSFDQEGIMEELKKTDINDPQYVRLAQEQKKIKDDSKIIEDSLLALSKRVIQLKSIINKEITNVKFNMDKAIDELQERRTALANSRQQYSMTSINNLALLLDEAMQQMQMQMQAGNGKCKKPGSGSPSPGNMKNAQKQLNEQLKKLKEAMEKGNNPGGKKGDKPGSDGSGGTSKELAKMAAKQAAIRRAVEQMQEQIENGKGSGGELGKLKELMEETETDIVNKKITNQTLLRQQDILTRLLQSEKAEREREKDQQRKAEEFTDEISRNQNTFLKYNRQKEREIELLKTLPPSFNNFYKTKVTEYFNQLER